MSIYKTSQKVLIIVLGLLISLSALVTNVHAAGWTVASETTITSPTNMTYYACFSSVVAGYGFAALRCDPPAAGNGAVDDLTFITQASLDAIRALGQGPASGFQTNSDYLRTTRGDWGKGTFNGEWHHGGTAEMITIGDSGGVIYSTKSKYFAEPYIYGKFISSVDKADVSFVRFTIYSIDENGLKTIVPATSGMVMQTSISKSYSLDDTYRLLNNGGAEAQIAKPTASNTGAGSATFLTISGENGLPDGKYQIVVDEKATEQVLKEMGDKFWKGFWGLAGVAYDAATCMDDIPKCASEIANKQELRVMGSADVTIANGKSVKNVEVELQVVSVSMLDKAFSDALRTLGGFIDSALKWTMGQIRALLTSTADYVLGVPGMNDGMLGPWTAMRNIGLSLLVLALVIIAFANVLQIDIEQYGLNRVIPKIIISIIMAFSSWVIVVFFFDFAKVLQDQAVGLIGGTNGLDVLGGLSISTPTAGDIVGKFGAILVMLAILFGVLVCGIVLLFTLLIRIVMLSFLLAVAPLAFILNIVPFTSSLYKQWWSEFFKWMFMGPIALVIIALGSVIASSVGGFGNGQALTESAVSTSTTGGGILIGLLIFAASLYMAAMLPMQWGGKIMQSWGKAGKGLKNWAGKTSGVSGAAKLIGDRANLLGANSQARSANRLATFVSGGRLGMNPEQFKRNQMAGLLNAESKRYEFQDKGQFTAAYRGAKNDTNRQAILLAGLKAGMVDDTALGADIAQQAEKDGSGLIMAAAMKDQRGALVEHGSPAVAQKAAEDIIKKFSTAKGNEFTAITNRQARGGINAAGLQKYGGAITQKSIDKIGETQPGAVAPLTKLVSQWNGPSVAPVSANEQATAVRENEALDARRYASSPEGVMARDQSEAERINALANSGNLSGDQQAADWAAKHIDDQNKH